MSMFFEGINTGVIDVDALPWMPFLPYTDKAFVKAIKVDPVRGEWITLLKAPADMVLPKHHHSGTVHVYTLSGSWKYQEHDWVATAGSFVFETAGTAHTPVGVGDAEIITLNIVQGDWIILGENDQVLAIENWKTVMRRYLDFCAATGLTPVDISSFQG
ncbi:ChrR-like protein with cupin domain [Fluviicoccus keumensis]|uniref:ChrR-like protein with cupin domain n=1 Tax=Fluviicoccus keumensis TaxID=1435465 RepID=A0A4Q7YPC7_9GAMM|nr:2,4'-dihydroxyacetophenone dioxygenase family protein [Fluviicoccus keumensis]RZU38723.1 ChrR-like protein with cupin domain [Fluviicoccus keumensis]